jgi:hypothetical protein
LIQLVLFQQMAVQRQPVLLLEQVLLLLPLGLGLVFLLLVF